MRLVGRLHVVELTSPYGRVKGHKKAIQVTTQAVSVLCWMDNNETWGWVGCLHVGASSAEAKQFDNLMCTWRVLHHYYHQGWILSVCDDNAEWWWQQCHLYGLSIDTLEQKLHLGVKECVFITCDHPGFCISCVMCLGPGPPGESHWKRKWRGWESVSVLLCVFEVAGTVKVLSHRVREVIQ